MTHGSLFSGIGGFDLAAEWMGWENIFHCEWNPFGQKVLKYYWPNAISYENICTTDFTVHRGKVDIITGGFPCQPYSLAGKRLGKEDERHLWPEMLRAIREVQPRWVVGENVFGLVNWSGGLVFHEVQADLEAQGYEVQPYILPAVSVNAPHRRDRVWFVAHANGIIRKCSKGESNSRNEQSEKWKKSTRITSTRFSISQNASNTTNIRREDALENGKLEGGRLRQSYKRNAWDSFPSVSPICIGDDGISNRLDGITFSKWRQESVKAGGNAIVPQVAYQIFKTIELYERSRITEKDR
jgi:DNA (cytosine-5)-methyltransferase 1